MRVVVRAQPRFAGTAIPGPAGGAAADSDQVCGTGCIGRMTRRRRDARDEEPRLTGIVQRIRPGEPVGRRVAAGGKHPGKQKLHAGRARVGGGCDRWRPPPGGRCEPAKRGRLFRPWRVHRFRPGRVAADFRRERRRGPCGQADHGGCADRSDRRRVHRLPPRAENAALPRPEGDRPGRPPPTTQPLPVPQRTRNRSRCRHRQTRPCPTRPRGQGRPESRLERTVSVYPYGPGSLRGVARRGGGPRPAAHPFPAHRFEPRTWMS